MLMVKYLASKDDEYADPGTAQQPWGSNDIVLIDPFGNRLIFTDGFGPS